MLPDCLLTRPWHTHYNKVSTHTYTHKYSLTLWIRLVFSLYMPLLLYCVTMLLYIFILELRLFPAAAVKKYRNFYLLTFPAQVCSLGFSSQDRGVTSSQYCSVETYIKQAYEFGPEVLPESIVLKSCLFFYLNLLNKCLVLSCFQVMLLICALNCHPGTNKVFLNLNLNLNLLFKLGNQKTL